MLNIRNNQLDKIIITAMDRFVWFVLLVVFSHLVTEFTRVTGYTRGSRHDSVMVNDSSMRQIKVQNQIQYPGQEFGQYETQPGQANYNGNSNYNNYDNNNNNNYNQNQIRDDSNNNNNNNNNNYNNVFTSLISGLFNGVGFVRPIIDSIFDIPISTLRAVNNLVGSLTFNTRRQQQQQQMPQFQPLQQLQQLFGFNNNPLWPGQQQQQQQSSSPAFTASDTFNTELPKPFVYGRSATIEPKSEFEMLKRIRQGDNSNNNSNSNSNGKSNSNSNSNISSNNKNNGNINGSNEQKLLQ